MTGFDLGPSAEDSEDSDTSASEADSEPATEEVETEPAPEPEPETAPEESAVEQEAADPHSTPAFEFSETDQHQIYVRSETWSTWEKTRDGRVKPELIMDDIEDVRKSEIQDAVLRIANENPEMVAEYVREARGLDDE